MAWTGGQVAISGIGYGPVGRSTGYSELQLALMACREAVDDAGLTPDAVDGLSMFPVRNQPPSEFDGPALATVRQALGLGDLEYCLSVGKEAGQLGAVFAAVYAVASGTARHALVFRAHKRQSRRYLPSASDVAHAWDEDAWTLPYGVGGGAARTGLMAARYMHEHNLSQEELGAVAISCRRNAQHNSRAIWYGSPISVDDYLAARWVSAPLKLLDCDYPIDGAVALVISAAGPARGETRHPVFIESIGQASGRHATWLHEADLTEMASRDASKQLWRRTELSPADVAVAEVYDGFSWFVLAWLEDLGFCPRGEAGARVAEGDTGLPAFCTDGGQLGGGRLHGFGKVAQAVKQLRGEAGTAQVSGVRAAVSSVGGGPLCGAMLLTSQAGTR
jgi:acetyl-CoA acetyltransferase